MGNRSVQRPRTTGRSEGAQTDPTRLPPTVHRGVCLKFTKAVLDDRLLFGPHLPARGREQRLQSFGPGVQTASMSPAVSSIVAMGGRLLEPMSSSVMRGISMTLEVSSALGSVMESARSCGAYAETASLLVVTRQSTAGVGRDVHCRAGARRYQGLMPKWW